jgi:XTP/dITP diphosphohydrolase
MLPDEEFGAELMLVVAQARAAGIDPETEPRAAAKRYAEHVRRWRRSCEP